MSQDAIQHKGVAPAPLYTAASCEDSTAKLAETIHLAPHYETETVHGIEVLILRWLMDNNMVICKRN